MISNTENHHFALASSHKARTSLSSKNRMDIFWEFFMEKNEELEVEN
jgi:hypothetical protein